ncbi:WW domain-containing protein [Coccidioides immitis RS]|uniref:WW domain-containing protein n=1 Tax=Coccidioides immitis (strain RS) TaxID=246410 RepID=A0A0E1RWB6_COCIM|nr:WW domain-containing protein [Coccidioides immitis RS]EAS31799.1 WW domain-containing protein [Coccidioides immitis RS]TPX24517.1 hypothetical protein DIZ76_013864 [Coccidioides immitis]
MTSNGRGGGATDEMFLSSPSDRHPSTVSPLRIVKRDSPSPSRASGAGQQASSRPMNRAESVSPLPYPDDPSRRAQARDRNTSVSRPPYPDAGQSASMSARSTENSSPASPGPGASEIPEALRPRQDSKQSQPTLAERRGAVPKSLPESPNPEPSDREGLFQRLPQRERVTQKAPEPVRKSSTAVNPYPEYHQQYWPPPTSSSTLQPENNSAINRLSSTASTSTTKAQRGSPPPPETPIVPPNQQPASGIEARYAASGIAGTSTLNNLNSHNFAAQQRATQYSAPQPNRYPSPARAQVQPPPQPQPRPWTPTEQPGTQPHGPPQVYQGSTVVGPAGGAQAPPGNNAQQPPQQPSQQPPQQLPQQAPPGNQIQYANQPSNGIEDDFQRLNMTASPPPAYSSLAGVTPHRYPPEKFGAGQAAQQTSLSAAMSSGASAPTQGSAQGHPAFANDPRQQQTGTPAQHPPQNGVQSHPAPTPTPGPASPPPLPEGWIAHLDPNSGQYYYIHLPTQSTQWEFPKGPTPLNLNDAPISPSQSTFGGHGLSSPGLSTFGKPLASPAFSAFGHPMPSPGMPMSPGYEPSVMSFNSGYIGPPPTSGIELYKVSPTNGVYFGPYLRYKNMDIERGQWLGSILLVTDAPQPPTIHIHKSIDLSPNPRQLSPVSIAAHQRWTFYRYDIDLQMDDAGPAKWTYAITSHLGCTRYEFLVAGRHETNWRFIATSGNDFSINVNANERSKLGGVGYLWKDIMQKHVECGGFHAHLGLGGQINADRLWKELPSLKQWLSISGKEVRKNAAWTAALEEDVTHAYFHYYTSHFDQPHLREAFAQIPHVLQVDDHDIFDGFGSYPDHMQFSNMFKNIGRIGIEMYLLFQHHTTLEVLRHVSDDIDLFTITGTGWHFVKYLGPAIAVVGIDCRSERNPHQVLAGPSYQGIFPKVAMLPPSVQHCIWMISVPLVYPRLDTAEHLAQTVATGKKAVTGAYNMLGKVTSSVAGVVGAKGAVGSGFNSVKRAVGKSGLMGSVLSPFGDIDFLDELRDQWTHDSKDLERTYLIRTLQGIAHQRSIRMTFLSGSVNLCGAGLVHDPSHPTDHKTMYQIISSSVVNASPPSYILKLLHGNNKPLYVPPNGHRSTPSQPTDTKEDMMELFQTDVAGQQREHRKLMGRRNYVAIVGYDPDSVNAAYTGMPQPQQGHGGSPPGAFPKLSLAVDFLVQGEGAFGNVIKYGPVIVPSLELGR